MPFSFQRKKIRFSEIWKYWYLLFACYVGQDAQNNTYWTSRAKSSNTKERRYVLYGAPHYDASAIPPLWNAWLHHMIDEHPQSSDQPRAQQFYGNMSGTKLAHLPPGHMQQPDCKERMQSTHKKHTFWNP